MLLFYSANILLTKEGRAKVGDYGLMRVQNAEENGSYTNQTTQVLGTTLYMPPESLRSSVVSPKWDVYSFGVVRLRISVYAVNLFSFLANI